jgi:hypothetical protein
MRRITIAPIVACLLLAGSTAVAQIAPADSLRPDTLMSALPDSVERVDTVDPVRPFFPTASPFGSIVPAASPLATRIVSELSLASMRYFTAFDALRRMVPALPLSQGLPGLVRGFSVAGAPPSAVSASFNGRPLERLAAYGYDLELYPMEFLERAEIVTGARALLYGTGEALMAVNFTQPRFDVEASYIRAWYAQDAGDLTGGDLMYARNIGRRANLSLGFRRVTSGDDANVRFENQEVSTWSVHANATWRPIPSLMLSLTELFSDASRSQNGGLIPESSRSPFADVVYEPFWEEQTLRHDVTLAAEWIAGGRSVRGLDTLLASGVPSGRLDSAIRIDAAAYYSYGERQLAIGDSIVEIDGGMLRTLRTRAGIRAGLWVPLSFARLEANAIAELVGARDRSESTSTFDLGRRQAGLLLELPVGSLLALRAGARYGRGPEGEIGGAAAELIVRPSERLSARVGARVQQHACPCEDPLRLVDTPGEIRFEDFRTSLLAEASIAYQDSSTLASLLAFARRAEPLDPASGLESALITGAEARVRIPFWLLALEAHVHGTLTPDADTRFPRLRAFGDLFAPLRLIEGNLDLRVGTTLEYQTPTAGAFYDIVSGSFLYLPAESVTTFSQFPTWDAYAQARIGSAYLRLALRNILDVESWSVYRYPERGRSFVFEVTWSFID